MRRKILAAVAMLCASLSLPVMSAPLFPDVPDNHWAKDAVAALAAKGLVEGYPDGTFKGDRAASRWEVAMVVARLLAKMEQEHATFATKAELEELRKLVNALREELDALGVRVKNLEENVDRLDKRVTELERITFYGEVNTRFNAQSFRNTGSIAMLPAAGGAVTLNYANAVGTPAAAGGPIQAADLAGAAGLNFNPFVFGVLSTTDWRGGRPFFNGQGFSSSALLGVRVRVSDDIDANAEFAAYTAQGDTLVDGYWGQSAPYLSNMFTANNVQTFGTAGLQPQNMQPYTRMTLDNLWVRHNPSKTTLTIGSFSDTHFDSITYVPQLNPNYNGPKYLDGFGVQVRGELATNEEESNFFKWEVMGTRLADGNAGIPATAAAAGIVNPTAPGAGYFTHAEGLNLSYHFDDDRGVARFNFLHAANDASGGSPLQVGLILSPNATLNWVNPSGFFVGQIGGPGNAAGIGSVTDARPVPGITLPGINPDGSLAPFVAAGLPLAGVPNIGGIGPQGQTMYGLTFNYTFDNEYNPFIRAEWSHSDYKPNRLSTYKTNGDAFRVGVGAQFFDESVDVEVNYLSVDPNYDPFVIQMPTPLVAHPGTGNLTPLVQTALWRSPDFNYYNNLYSLHDSQTYVHNREGVRAAVTWRFLPTGRISVDYGNLNQKVTSLQDVRFSAGSIAPGTPNTLVLGYSPGFMEPVFGGFHPATFAASGTNLVAVPLENPTGKMEHWSVVGGYKYLFNEEESNQGVLFSGGFRNYNWFRPSAMSSILPGPAGLAAHNQNLVDVTNRGYRLQVDYDVTTNYTVGVGYTNVDIFGHLDPLGVYNAFAIASGNPNYTIIDITQRIPGVQMTWNIEENMTWGLDARYIFMTDNVNPAVFASPTVPALNLAFGPQVGTHPFNWQGYQLNSSFSFKF